MASVFLKRWLPCLAGITFWLGMPATADDDYLSILEAEADDTGARTGTDTVTIANRPARTIRRVQDHQTIMPAMGFEEFEAELKANFSGTWFLYDKLTGMQRKAVYIAYQEDNRTSKVREMIVGLLSPG